MARWMISGYPRWNLHIISVSSHSSCSPARQVVMQLVDEGRVSLDEIWRSVAGGRLEAQLSTKEKQRGRHSQEVGDSWCIEALIWIRVDICYICSYRWFALMGFCSWGLKPCSQEKSWQMTTRIAKIWLKMFNLKFTGSPIAFRFLLQINPFKEILRAAFPGDML